MIVSGVQYAIKFLIIYSYVMTKFIIHGFRFRFTRLSAERHLSGGSGNYLKIADNIID